MLKLDSIHTYYGEGYVLQGLSLEVSKASVVAMLGRNGMGKTTTIRSILGAPAPRRGKIFFKAEDITGMESYRIAQKGIGLVPQGRRLFPSLSVAENLRIVPKAGSAGVWNMERVAALFPRLKERADTKANFLSGGELQMLAIARGLIGNPDLLLMDEPSEGLAPIVVAEIGRVIRQLKAETGLSILLVEQNIKLATDVADTVYLISKGKVVYESTAREFAADGDAKARYLGV